MTSGFRKPEKLHTKLLELINEFSKVAGFKINIQKLVVFLYINSKTSERNLKQTISFKMAAKT